MSLLTYVTIRQAAEKPQFMSEQELIGLAKLMLKWQMDDGK